MFLSPITVALAVVVGIFLLSKWKFYYNLWKYGKDIPGPKGHFFLGNLLEVLVGGTEENFTLRQKYTEQFPDLYKLKILNFLIVHIYKPEDMETILTDMSLLTKGQPYELIHEWLGSGLLTSTGEHWQNRRKILTPAFHFSILQEFLEIFNRETDSLVEDLKKTVNKPIDVVKPITEYTLSSIGETSLGIQINKEPNCDKYKSAIYFVGDFLAFRIIRPWLNVPYVSKLLYPLVQKNSKEIKTLHDFSLNVIKKRKQQMQKDGFTSYSVKKRLALLDLLLKAKYKDNVDINEEGIREEVDTFMFEGHDTTAVALCYAMLAFANEPKIQEEMYQEIYDILGDKKHPDYKDLGNMNFMERCIKEVLRIYPSAPAILRRATKNVQLKSGYVIPEGSDIGIMIYSMHHSKLLWDEPEKFDPDRFLPENIAKRHPFAYLPFSAGPRNCIGQKYAMLELKAALCGIMRNFKLEPITRPSDLRFKIDLVLRSVDKIKVKFVPRK